MGAEKQKNGKLHRECRCDESGQYIDSGCYLMNNTGYSLIELVIVLAIIAIIMSTVFYSIILIFSANAKSCANDIQRSIGDCKVTTMGRASAYMTLYRDTANENVYTKMYIWDKGAGDYVESEPQRVGTRRVTVKYKAFGDVEKELLAGDEIEIWFDRATGGFADNASHTFYEHIRVEGGSKNFRIAMTQLTGKSEVVAETP